MTKAQQREYYALLRDLMTYANDRLGVVRDFDVFDPTWPIDAELEEKCLLVLEELWRTPDIIDDFVRESSYRLSANALSLVQSWKDALFSVYIVLSVEDGTARLMGNGMLFEVRGFANTLELGFPVLPVCVEGALLPYGDAIIMQEPIRVYGLPPVSSEEADAYASSMEGEPVTTARVFRLVSRAEKTRALQNKIDYLLNDADLEDEPCAGFHHGALFGLGEAERERRVEEEAVALLKSMNAEGWSDGEDGTARAEPEGGRDPQAEAAALLEACAYLYGVIDLGEAYRLHRSLACEPLGLDEFRDIAAGSRVDVCTTGLTSRHGIEYVVNHVLSIPCMVHDAVREVHDVALIEELASLEEQGATTGELLGALRSLLDARPAGDDVRERIKALYERYEGQTNEYIDQLIDEHLHTQRCPLDPDLVKAGWFDYACALPEALALRNFLDGVVPDGENDFFFADRTVEDLVRVITATGSLGSAMRVLKQYGYPHGVPSTVKLIRLVINFYKALPSWDDNGWSRREHMERLTGRKVFYAPDGSELRLAASDPCPCGSGMKYGECCGKRRQRVAGGVR